MNVHFGILYTQFAIQENESRVFVYSDPCPNIFEAAMSTKRGKESIASEVDDIYRSFALHTRAPETKYKCRTSSPLPDDAFYSTNRLQYLSYSVDLYCVCGRSMATSRAFPIIIGQAQEFISPVVKNENVSSAIRVRWKAPIKI